ncbi:TonB-dependent receptor domain-containing protein [Cognatilysobacter tabacisoli]|uniref:TonB-dependent receptor domain-containing protein n=1 Tax=Cognatilysobacter tabacisoli TaxID=2315424 RepID=UPI0018C879FB|nr:TonB-dependent receptor [Lysobacter tabacisoli]
MSDTQIRLRRSRLSSALFAAMVVPFAGVALAQDAATQTQPQPSSSQPTDIDKVTVVGSRIKRAEIEGPAPVTVITRADIDREGFQTVGDMLQTLTQNTNSSFTGDLAVTGFTPNAQVVNLRNLGPGYTLTLINGRRPAQYPQPYNRDNNVVNVRAIPSSIIERVEVLTGGASAIYGSDAIAGVVNIVLRKNYEGNNLRGTVGTTAEGGGDSVKLEYTGGRSGDRWSTTYAFQYGNNEPVFASQRDFLSDTRKGPLGPDFTNPALSLIAIRGNTTANGLVNQNAYYPGQAVCDRFGYTTRTTAARGTYCGSFTQPASRSISNKNQYYSAYGYGTFDLTDTTQLFASATYYDSEAKASSGTEFWGTSGDRFNTTRTGGTTAFYYDPQFGSLIQLQRVFNPFELGGAEAVTTIFEESTFDLQAGATGVFGERFDWEASIQHGEYDYTQDRPRLLAKAVHDYFLGPRLGFATNTGVQGLSTSNFPIHRLDLNRWTTPFTAEQYKAVSTRVINEGTTESSSMNFNVAGDLFDLPAGSVGFAGVLEANRQSVDLRSDPRTNPLRPADEQTVYNLVSSGRTQGERDRYAVGVEFAVPVFTNFDAQLAARYDKYDDITQVDDAITYNLGLKWRVFDSLLLRASAATSFRAPDLQLVYAEGAASFAGALDEYACRSGTGAGAAAGPRTRTQCNVAGDPTIYTVQTRIAGNSQLKEEEGESFTAGFVWDITDSMNMSVDYYRIKLEDAADQLGSDFILRSEAACRLGSYSDGRPVPTDAFCASVANLVTRTNAPGSPLDGRIEAINDGYINTALRDLSGIDANFRYRLDTDRYGTFSTDLGYSLTLTDKYKLLLADPLIDYRDLPPTFYYVERSRARGSVSWSKGDWNATVFGTRYGSAYSNAAVPGRNAAGGEYGRRLAPWMLYNVQVGKRFGENLRADFTIVNVTNNQYREDNSLTGYPFFNPFLGADPLGRRFFVSVSYNF